MWWKEQWAAMVFDWYWLTSRNRLVQLDFVSNNFKPKPFEVLIAAGDQRIKFLISNYYLIIKK